MPVKPAAPVVPSRDIDPVAAAVIDDALKVRASHPAVLPLDILDLVLRGRRTRSLNFDVTLSITLARQRVRSARRRGL